MKYSKKIALLTLNAFFCSSIHGMQKEQTAETCNQTPIALQTLAVQQTLNQNQQQNKPLTRTTSQQSNAFQENVETIKKLCKAGDIKTAQAIVDIYKGREPEHRLLQAIINETQAYLQSKESEPDSKATRIQFIYLPTKDVLRQVLNKHGMLGFAEKTRFIEKIEKLKNQGDRARISEVDLVIAQATKEFFEYSLKDAACIFSPEELLEKIPEWKKKLSRALYLASPEAADQNYDTDEAGILHSTAKSKFVPGQKEIKLSMGSTGFIQSTESSTSWSQPKTTIFIDRLHKSIVTATYLKKINQCPTTKINAANPELGYPHRPPIKHYAAITQYPLGNELHEKCFKAALERGLKDIVEMLTGKTFIFVPGEVQAGTWSLQPKKEHLHELNKLMKVAKGLLPEIELEIVPYQEPNGHYYEEEVKVTMHKIMDNGKSRDQVELEYELPGQRQWIKLH